MTNVLAKLVCTMLTNIPAGPREPWGSGTLGLGNLGAWGGGLGRLRSHFALNRENGVPGTVFLNLFGLRADRNPDSGGRPFLPGRFVLPMIRQPQDGCHAYTAGL